mgnify:FL=1
MSKARRIALIAFLCLSIIGIILVYFKLEWVEKKTDLGPVIEVQQQDYLAAQRFLKLIAKSLYIEQGYTSLDTLSSSDNLSQKDPIQEGSGYENTRTLPSSNDLIVIPDGYGALSELRSNKLLDWVSAGGSLIVTASNPYLSSIDQRPDFIFENFGVFPVNGEKLEVEGEIDDKKKKGLVSSDVHLTESPENQLEEGSYERWNPQQNCRYLEDTLSLTVYGEVNLSIGLNAGNALNFEEGKEDDFFFWSSNQRGIQIIQAYYGEGMVTFLSGTNAWKNDYIACLDNAYFLRFLTGSTEQVWFLVNQDNPSLISLAWNNFPYFIVVLFIFIVFLVWHFGQRFGTIKPQKPLNRRQILEHIDASSLFLWRHKTSRWLLVETVQQSIRKKMKLRNANFDAKTIAQQFEMIAQSAQLPIDEIKVSMVELTDKLKSQVLTEQNFIVLMKSLKRIEGKL